MTNYLETKISQIVDADFQTLITELCGCVGLAEDQVENMTLANLLTAIVKEKKKMALQNVAISLILETRIRKLSADSVVYGVCCELVRLKRSHIELFVGKSVFTLIKQCHKAVCPPQGRAKKPTLKKTRIFSSRA